MRKRRRHIRAKDNTDRWLISYADYMTLLFALFVLLYAAARVNPDLSERYQRQMEQAIIALEQRFTQAGSSSAELNKPNDSILEGTGQAIDFAEQGKGLLANQEQSNLGSLPELANYLAEEFKDLLESDDIVVAYDDKQLVIELDSRLFFASGSANLLRQAKPRLLQLAQVLNQVNNYVTIAAYSDVSAVDGELYRDNWDLSAQRALRVMRELHAQGVMEARLSAQAHGKFAQSITGAKQQAVQPNMLKVLVSKQQWQAARVEVGETEPFVEQTKAEPQQDSDVMLAVPLQGGGVRFTTRQEEP